MPTLREKATSGRWLLTVAAALGFLGFQWTLCYLLCKHWESLKLEVLLVLIGKAETLISVIVTFYFTKSREGQG